MAALDTLVNPPFANDPPVKVNLDAKVVGLVVAILAGIGALFGLLALLGLLAAGAAFAGIFFLAIIGLIVGLVGDVMATIGGWQMYQGKESGKRLAIYGLALTFLAEIILMIGFSAGSSILQLILLAVFYYAIVVSRYPGQAPSASRGL